MLPFKFTGKVIPGNKMGRKIGFPTANLDRVPRESALTPGVYVGTCNIYQNDRIRNQELKCLVYFGPRYVFSQKQNSFEVYLYNFNQSIYDLTLEVKLIKFIRAPKKTASLIELKEQLEKDKRLGQQQL
ncbi:riboflavin kinase [Patescibacteria group bacterium]|nr:riboflavin kinase [Patescibacteria group bacterium]MBU1885307.1 riboflavin kinase [Patescibacteria group bacterium]